LIRAIDERNNAQKREEQKQEHFVLNHLWSGVCRERQRERDRERERQRDRDRERECVCVCVHENKREAREMDHILD